MKSISQDRRRANLLAGTALASSLLVFNPAPAGAQQVTTDTTSTNVFTFVDRYIVFDINSGLTALAVPEPGPLGYTGFGKAIGVATGGSVTANGIDSVLTAAPSGANGGTSAFAITASGGLISVNGTSIVSAGANGTSIGVSLGNTGGTGLGSINIGSAATPATPLWTGAPALEAVTFNGDQNIFLQNGSLTAYSSTTNGATLRALGSGNINATWTGTSVGVGGIPGGSNGDGVFLQANTGAITFSSSGQIGVNAADTFGSAIESVIVGGSALNSVTHTGNAFAAGAAYVVDNNGSGGVSVTTAGNVTAGAEGIIATTETGALTVNASGTITSGAGFRAIDARVLQSTTADILVNNAAAINQTAGNPGQEAAIVASFDDMGLSGPSGAVTVTNTGAISADAASGAFIEGISAFGAASVTVTTSGGGSIGQGVSVTGNGITALTSGNAGPGIVTVTANAAVTGARGIAAQNFGIGSGPGQAGVIVTGTANVTGTLGEGVNAVVDNVVNASDVVVSLAGNVRGVTRGIFAQNRGLGGVDVGGTGDTTSTNGIAVLAAINATNNAANVAVTRSGNVTSNIDIGILASTVGTGNVTVGTVAAPVAVGNITAAGAGIVARTTSGSITVNTASGTIQSGNDSIFAQVQGVGAAGSIVINNAASLARGPAGFGIGIRAVMDDATSTGAITINNTGSIGTLGAANFFTGISATGYGPVTVTNSGSIGSVNIPSNNGIDAVARGNGAVSVASNAAFVAGGFSGIRAIHLGVGPGAGLTAIAVSGTGTVTSNGGGSGILANIDNAANAGNIVVTHNGTINAPAALGILAITAGAGNVTVGTAASPVAVGNIVADREGVAAQAEAGNVVINTGTGTIQSGNLSSAVVGQVDFTGGSGSVTINNAASLTKAAGAFTQGAGINATSFAGNVTINNTGAIGSVAGTGTFSTGIFASTDSGAIIIATSGAGTIGTAIAPVTSGIGALGFSGGTISITADAAVSVSTDPSRRSNAISATAQSGSGLPSVVSVGGSGALTGRQGIIAQTFNIGVAGANAIAISGTGGITANGNPDDPVLLPTLSGAGIYARITASSNAGNIAITRSGPITATGYGISAVHRGVGDIVIGTTGAPVAVGNITAGRYGIGADHSNAAAAGNISVVTGAGTVQGGTLGIAASVAGSGRATVTTGGAVIGLDGSGVFLSTIAGGGGSFLTVLPGSTITASNGFAGVTAARDLTVLTSGTISGASGAASILLLDGTNKITFGNANAGLNGNVRIGVASAAVSLELAQNNGVDTVLTNGSLSGPGSATKTGADRVTFAGANSIANGQFTGTLAINQGTIGVDGVFGDTAANAAIIAVNAGGTLVGNGTIAGSVTNNGGTISAGSSPGTLTVAGNYTVVSGTELFELGAPGVVGGASNDLINVGGDLTLGGTLRLVSASNAANPPVSGAYRLYNYGGTLSGNFAAVTTPAASASALVYANIPSQLNVLLTNGNQQVQYWDGVDTTGAVAGDGGGTATWNATNTNWTTLPGGQVNDLWRSGVGMFGGTAGTVTVAGVKNFQGLQFTVGGYSLTGAALNMTGDPFTTPAQSFINVDAGVSATIANALTASGGIGLIKVGAGTLTLTGASTYTGTTTVSAGTLAIGPGGSLTQSASLANTGAFQVDTGGTASFATVTNNAGAAVTATGAFTTTGAFANAGTFNATGPLATVGALANEGVANIAGMLAAASLSGSNAAAQINVGGTLNVGASGAPISYAGLFTGAGAINKAGSGVFTLGASNTTAQSFAGTLNVPTSTLVLNNIFGDLAAAGGLNQANVVIGSGNAEGGRLEGTGTLAGNLRIAGGGTVAPAAGGRGTLTVNGNVTFDPGAHFAVDLVPGTTESDLLSVGGAAAVDGDVVVTLAPGTFLPSQTYTIVSATGGVSGQFDGISQNSGGFVFLGPRLGYSPTTVTLTIGRNGGAFSDVAATPNQAAAANGLDSLTFANAANAAVTLLGTVEEARTAFDLLSGEVHASVQTGLIEDARHIRDTVSTRLDAVQDGSAEGNEFALGTAAHAFGAAPVTGGHGMTGWVSGFGSWGESDDDSNNAADFDRSIGGVLIGADGMATDTTALGFLIGYSHSSFDADARLSSADADSLHVGVYAGTEVGGFGLKGDAAYTYSDIDTQRSVAFAGFADSLTADYDADTAQVWGEAGYEFKVNQTTIEPFANLAYVNVDTSSFAEQGGAAALAAGSESADQTFSTLGVRASTDLGSDASLSGMIGWRHAFGDDAPDTTLAFAGGTPFSVTGAPFSEDAFVAGVGLSMQLAPQSTFSFGYSGQFGNNSVDNGFKAALDVQF